MRIIWLLNTIKFLKFEKFIFHCWYKIKSQNWSHIKYEYSWKVLIVPKHKNIARWTLNNVFKIIAFNSWFDKKTIENEFFMFVWKK